MFTIDGLTWDVLCKIERTAEVKASEISGILLDKSYFNDVLGTYMRYDLTIHVPIGREAAYNTIYEALTDPVDGHAFILPYNSGMVEITGRVTAVKDVYVRMPGIGTRWKETRVTVIANHPTKELSLDEVITRGAAPLPGGGSASMGSSYTYTAQGWEELYNADAMAY